MQLDNGNYYHLYNRTNNKEVAFKEERNYLYFLKKYRKGVSPFVDTFAYILMPTHFHFLIKVTTNEIALLKDRIGRWQSSYEKGINKAYKRSGSLFQLHAKAILVDEEGYLICVLNYIHQNALRAKLVKKLEEWPYSSYQDLAGFRKGTLPDNRIIRHYFKTTEDFREYSNQLMTEVKEKYWVH